MGGFFFHHQFTDHALMLTAPAKPDVLAMDRDGFHTVTHVIPLPMVRDCIAALDAHADHKTARSRRGATYAMRQLLAQIPLIRELAISPALRALVESVLGTGAFPVRGILFDKNPQVNWSVAWHQDCAIAVKQKVEATGFGPWSVKAEVVHVEPPVHVLESMVTLRIHLDDCDESNGPLRVVPGSHRHGKLDENAMATLMSNHDPVTCCVPAGGVLMMRPLLLHASSQVQSQSAVKHRRVIHIEYANGELPGGLQWFEK